MITIIGAGPAGLFAARELAKKGMKRSIVEKGKGIKERECPMLHTGKCILCKPCDIMCGIGGAGTFSSGILNLRPDVGGNLMDFVGEKEAWELVDEVDGVFLKYGAPKKFFGDGKELKKEAASIGAKFIQIKQRHIGSDRTAKVISNFEDELQKKGVEFLIGKEAEDLIIKNGKCGGVIVNGEPIHSEYTILAPGRSGASWMNEMVKKYGIKASYGAIDVGVRVEVPSIIMDPITSINRDPKFHLRTKKYDDFVRTFCTNERGFVVKESYNGFIGTNGHSLISRETENTNFAFLVRIELTEPVENTILYGRSIAELATTIGGGKPIIQRMGDLRRGQRSTRSRIERNSVANSLKEVTPGDISMALPHRIIVDIIEGLEMLDEIIPGIASDSTLLYAPEVKFYSMILKVNDKMETSIKNLYAAGDGAGLSRDLVNASATGILAGRGVYADIDTSR